MPTPLQEAVERSRRTTRVLGRLASLLLVAAAVLTATDGRWWRALYLVAAGVLVWLVLGRRSGPPRPRRNRPPDQRR